MKHLRILAALLASVVAARAEWIDVLVVFDTTAKTWLDANAGGSMSIKASAYVAKLNQSMVNSGLPDVQFRLAGVDMVNYTTTKDLRDDLVALATPSDGIMDNVHAIRNAVNADLVTLLVDIGSAYGTVGMGYLLPTINGMPEYGFNTCAIRSVDIADTMSHEIGHNLGLHHAVAQGGRGLEPYAQGWYFPGVPKLTRDFYTIMAYNSLDGVFYNPCGLFSSPSLRHQGGTAGHGELGDSVRCLRRTASVVAGNRTATDQVARVIATPAGGSYVEPVSVALACATSGAEIRYTLDGSTPTAASTLYTTPLLISSSTVLKARAFKDALLVSPLATAPFEITTPQLLRNGQRVQPVTVEAPFQRHYRIDVPAGQTNLTIRTWCDNADADLYARYGVAASINHYTTRSADGGSNERIDIRNPDAGAWYIAINAFSTFTDLALQADYSAPRVTRLQCVRESSGDTLHITVGTLAGWRYQLMHATTLKGPWQAVDASPDILLPGAFLFTWPMTDESGFFYVRPWQETNAR